MPGNFDYTQKFKTFKNQTLYEKLDPQQRQFIKTTAFRHRFSFQEFRQVVEAARDLAMWGEPGLSEWWGRRDARKNSHGTALKKQLLQQLHAYLEDLRKQPKAYPAEGLPRPSAREKVSLSTNTSEKEIHGMCPVASENTVCCNLHTIDAVENCTFGCSYCTIQTFYNENFVFDSDFTEKLRNIRVQPERFYHFGTGQSSDSLVWGNRNGILDALCLFAADHPNILLEFKTKSDNIRYFLDHAVPKNIVCSWSLNTPTIIDNEEHFTARLEQRLLAARHVADKGIGVAFHFHPMVYYQGWEHDYPQIATHLTAHFSSDEVLFISFGSVTFIKPVIKKIRSHGHSTKMLQMEMVSDPHGKLTYPDEIKINMFKTMHKALQPWQSKVFMYLCMEKASIWEKSFGYVYPNNEEFEREFGRCTMSKLNK
ncbi:MAG: radical SAM protein [bacterium]